MAALPILKGVLSFLTILPVGGCRGRVCAECDECFAQATQHMYLFPLIGGFIGLLAGAFGWVLLRFLPSLTVGMLTLGFLLFVTGAQHTDGLLDFADGVMFLGAPERKIEVMHDGRTGAAGLALGLVTLGATALAIAELERGIMIQALVSSEVSAKLGMVMCAWVGGSAHPGLGRRFVEAMHGSWRNIRLAVALTVSFAVAVSLLWAIGAITLLSGIVTALAIVWISHRNFGGVTGDVIGAANDLARMVSLVTLLAAIRWA